MNNGGSTLERLRQQLADLESNQRAAGGTATSGFWSTPSADAAPCDPSAAAGSLWGAGGPVPHGAAAGATASSTGRGSPDEATSPNAGSPGSTSSTGSGAFGFPWPLALNWPTFTAVPGRLAPTFAFAAGITALPELQTVSLPEADLIASATQLGRLQQHREVALLRVVMEMESRAVVSPGGLSRVDWLRSLDPTLTASGAKAVVTCAAAFNEPGWHPLREAVTGGGEREGDAPEDDGTVGAGRVTVGNAAQIIDFHTRLKPVADPDDLDQAVTHLTDRAAGLRWELLARLARELSEQVRPPKDADDLDRKRRNARGLWFTGPNAAGMVGMTGTLDPEGAAIIKAAIDPLSSPCPLTDEAGVKIDDDPRPAHQRRMDALLEVVGRGVSAPGAAPTTDKAKVVVTIDFDTLRDWARHAGPAGWAATPTSNPAPGSSSNPGTGTGDGPGAPTTDPGPNPGPGPGAFGAATETGGTSGGSGSCETGDVLTAATVRRMACDAAIIPVILGSKSEPLDVGRQERLVTRPMRTFLWLRDRGCTFPGCSMPAQWTDAHHVHHWIHGGATKVSNLALLCRRHHVYVHDQELTATITDNEVTWHTWQHWRTAFNTGPSDPDP